MQIDNGFDLKLLIACLEMQGHQGPVTGVALCDLGNGKLLLVSTAADDNVLIWSNDSTAGEEPARLDAWHVQQRLSFPQHLQHSVAISALPSLPDWCDKESKNSL